MMETTDIKKQTNLFITFVLILVGCTVLGVGIGLLLSEIWACTLIGVGVGFLVSALLYLKSAYQK
jgi:hypothetical protein